MDRIIRLFGLMDSLRRNRFPIAAQRLAEEHEVSVRAVTRDLQLLTELGAPVDGEPGFGYMLRPGFFLPPIMLSPDELEAMTQAARWAEQLPDARLARAATSALAKLSAATPPGVGARTDDTALGASSLDADPAHAPVLDLLRRAMREERAILLDYADRRDSPTQRTILPLQLAHLQDGHIVAAWCCLRRAFRHFRIDRILHATLTDQPYHQPRAMLAMRWFDELEANEPDIAYALYKPRAEDDPALKA
jgi:predicted DNA-binding transcriptional regulator YafY